MSNNPINEYITTSFKKQLHGYLADLTKATWQMQNGLTEDGYTLEQLTHGSEVIVEISRIIAGIAAQWALLAVDRGERTPE